MWHAHFKQFWRSIFPSLHNTAHPDTPLPPTRPSIEYSLVHATMTVRWPCCACTTFVGLTVALYFGDRWTLRGAALQMVRSNVENGLALRGNIHGLPRVHTHRHPSEPGMRPVKEGPRACPVQHNHDSGMRKNILWLQEMW